MGSRQILFLLLVLSTFFGCSSFDPPVAEIGDEEITLGALWRFAAQRDAAIDATLLDTLVNRQVILRATHDDNGELLPDINRTVTDIRYHELISAYRILKVSEPVAVSMNRDTTDVGAFRRKLAKRMHTLSDSLWQDHRGVVYADSIRLLANLAAGGEHFRLSRAMRDVALGRRDEGEITIGEFLEKVRQRREGGLRQKLSDTAWLGKSVRSLLVSEIVVWEAHAMGLHEEPGFQPLVDAELVRVYSGLQMRRIAGDHRVAGGTRAGLTQAYATYLNSLRERYDVRLFPDNLPTSPPM